MSDRLKQIWTGFEGVTTRRLTGRGVDNIITPPRRDYAADDGSFIPEGTSAPSQQAFEALKTRLAVQEELGRRRGKKRRRAEADLEQAYRDDDTSPDAPEAAKEMLRGLKATEDRTVRTSASYAAQISSNAGRELDSLKKRKKFLGIF